MSALAFATSVLPGARRGVTARGLTILWMRPHQCVDCRQRRSAGLCMHPSETKVEAMADVLDAMVAGGSAKRLDGQRLGNGGTDSTIWYPA